MDVCLEGCSGGVSRPSRGAHCDGNHPCKRPAHLPSGAPCRTLPPAARAHRPPAGAPLPHGRRTPSHQPKNGSPAAVEGARRPRGSGAPACGRRSRTACESVRQGPPAGGALSTSKAGFRRNERLAKDAKRRQNTPPNRRPKRATKNAAISFKNGVGRRTFRTNMDAGFRWPFAPLRSDKIWPRKRGQITHSLAHFGPGGLKGYAVQRHFWHFFEFVEQIKAKV